MPNPVKSLGYIKCYNSSSPRPGKQDSIRYILKSSASMYERSDSQFFRTTTGKNSGSDVFDESGLIMTFLTIFRVTQMLCSMLWINNIYKEIYTK